MKVSLIGDGAEAKIYLIEEANEEFNAREIGIDEDLIIKPPAEKFVLKYRLKKRYRHPEIDFRLRKYRTRREYRILEKLSSKDVKVPRPLFVDEDRGILIMEFIEGEKLSQILERVDFVAYSRVIGETLAKIHRNGIAHGDLTTSNMILAPSGDLYFIDFGLSFFTSRIEDFAVDLHLLREAIESKHWRIYEKSWHVIIQAYLESFDKGDAVLKHLEKVESRGRYKRKAEKGL